MIVRVTHLLRAILKCVHCAMSGVPDEPASLLRQEAMAQVDYSLELGPPIVTLQDAKKQRSFHQVPPLPGPNSNLPNGEKSAIPYVEKCPMQIRGAKWHIPTQVTAAAFLSHIESQMVLVNTSLLTLGFASMCLCNIIALAHCFPAHLLTLMSVTDICRCADT